MSVGLAFALAFCAYAIQSVQFPGRVMACSCVPPRPLAEMVNDPTHVLVVATVGARVGGGVDPTTVLTIERAFTGEMPEQVLVQGIGDQVAACQLSATAGQRWIFGVYRSPEGRFGVSSCGVNAPLGTESGDALLAEAVGLFGEGQSPAPPLEQPDAPVDLAPWLNGIGFAALLVLVAAAIFGVVVLLARRRPS